MPNFKKFKKSTGVYVFSTTLIISIGITLVGFNKAGETGNFVANSEITQETDPPNFILIVADDLGFADLSINGSLQIQTPNIDQIAKNGVRFQEGYVSAPVCSPSRAGLITGRNQVHFGHETNLSNPKGYNPQYMGLPITERTIADYLNPLGYVNGLIGKWHLGYEDHFHPINRGFDEFWGFTGGGHDYFTSKPKGKGYKAPLESNYKNPQKITYITDDIGDESVGFIKRHKDDPFFLFASFNAPHTPLQATEDDLNLFSHIKNERRRTYLAMVHRLDQNVGKILKEVQNQGLHKNTIIVFISDNGGPVHYNNSVNAPYNGQKGILLEGGIHVPFLMQWPGVIPENTVYKNPVSSLDLAATFLTAAGKYIDKDFKLDGVDLIPYITGVKTSLPHPTLKWKFTISGAIRQGDWKLIRLPDRMPQLYHLPTDISEQKNVAMKNLERTEAMLKILGSWDVELPNPYFVEGDRWRKNQLSLYDKKYPLTQPK